MVEGKTKFKNINWKTMKVMLFIAFCFSKYLLSFITGKLYYWENVFYHESDIFPNFFGFYEFIFAPKNMLKINYRGV